MSQFAAFFVLVFPLAMTLPLVISIFINPRKSSQRPIYIIGHMVNGLDEIDEWLEKGSNALEADVEFDENNGEPTALYHGHPCDFGRGCTKRSNIGQYVEALKVRTKPSSSAHDKRLTWMMFDCKLADVETSVLTDVGQKFADAILIPLYEDNPTKMKTVISVPDFTRKDFIRGVLIRLRSVENDIEGKIGFEVSWEKIHTEPRQMEEKLTKLGVTPGHAWLSSGITNIVPMWASNFKEELRKQVGYKNGSQYFSKVYAWSVDKISSTATYLRLDVDGLITKKPGNVRKAMRQVNSERSDNKKIRVADLNDNPFEVFRAKVKND